MNTFAIINIAKAQLGIEEDDYRALLVRVTGVSSLRQMSESQRIAVVGEMKRQGFRIRGKGRGISNKGYVRKIFALWKACHQAGVIQDGSREALRAFCRRFIAPGDATVTVDPDLLSYNQAAPIIEALKDMLDRQKKERPDHG